MFVDELFKSQSLANLLNSRKPTNSNNPLYCNRHSGQFNNLELKSCKHAISTLFEKCGNQA